MWLKRLLVKIDLFIYKINRAWLLSHQFHYNTPHEYQSAFFHLAKDIKACEKYLEETSKKEK